MSSGILTKEHFIKSVIGIPGDTISIQDGLVYINGQKLEEDYLMEKTWGNMASVKVPPESVFVLGDNRNNSHDSRSPLVGFVPNRLIEGRAVWRYWPAAGSAGAGATPICPAQIRRKRSAYMNITALIAGELEIKGVAGGKCCPPSDEGNTIPFIARYRKEATGELDETVLWSIAEGRLLPLFRAASKRSCGSSTNRASSVMS